MSVRERPVDRGSRTTVRVRGDIGRELRTARRAAGISQLTVAVAADTSRAEVSRIERGSAPWLSVDVLCRLAAVLGFDPTIRLYPTTSPPRDAGHAALVERLHARLSPALRWRTEVPLPSSGDKRAWDAVITG